MYKLILFSVLFCGNFFYSQIISGKVISGEDNSPVPYAKIGIDQSVIGRLSDENGNFKIDLTEVGQNVSLKIEVAGFEPFENEISKMSELPLVIKLNPKIYNIQEVNIAGKNFTTKNLGSNSKKKNPSIRFHPVDSGIPQKNETTSELQHSQNPEVAIQIKTGKRSKISKINVNFAEFDLGKSVLSRFTVYAEKNGQPGEIINSEDILFSLSKDKIKDGLFTLDVSDKSIWVDDTIFISFEVVEKNISGSFKICAGLFGKGFMRTIVDQWKKIPVGIVPAIHIDVKTER